MKKNTVLITGAKGLIGREVVRLLHGNAPIKILDINPAELLPRNVDSVIGDINNPPASLFENVDTVIHLASVMGVEYTENHSIETIETIVNGTKKILELSAQNHVSRFVLASSSEVYGDDPALPYSEDGPVSPMSVYGSAKLLAEYLCKAFQKEHGLDYTILRIFNAFGKNQSDRFVIPRFIRMALQGGPLEIFGNGEQTRSFCHVSDVARYILKVIEMDATRNNIYNVGDPRNQISIRELAVKIMDLVRVPDGEINFPPMTSKPLQNPNREIFHRIPDISAISKVTGYQPAEDFTEGLLEIIEHERNQAAVAGRPWRS